MDLNTHLTKLLGIGEVDAVLLEQAITHRSYINEQKKSLIDYQRLEFMGDAVLEILVSEYIYLTFPQMDEGKMTVLRANAVREESLAKYATNYEIQDFIKVGRGERVSKGYLKESVLADVFEAVLGAIYLSLGYEQAKTFCKIVFETIDANDFNHLVDYKTMLQEYVQADSKRTVSYEVISVAGTGNNPIFEVQVKNDDIILGTGTGSSKKRAQQDAAKKALEKLVLK